MEEMAPQPQLEPKNLEVLFPKESGITEGNLAELPIWALSNREAKPVAEGGLIRKEDYSKTIVCGELQTQNGTLRRAITLHAQPNYGFPTMFAYRVLLVLLDECRAAGFASPIVSLTRYEIARRLGIKRPAKHQYDDIENALFSLKATSVEFDHSFHIKGSKEPAKNQLLGGFLYEAGLSDGPDPDADNPRKARKLIARLAEPLYESLQNRYFIGVDQDYLNELRRPLAERLYVYLTKKDGGPNQNHYTEGIKSLARKLGLKNAAPFHIMRHVRPALDRLCEGVAIADEGEARRFLDRWDFDEDKQQITVHFFKARNKPRLN